MWTHDTGKYKKNDCKKICKDWTLLGIRCFLSLTNIRFYSIPTNAGMRTFLLTSWKKMTAREKLSAERIQEREREGNDDEIIQVTTRRFLMIFNWNNYDPEREAFSSIFNAATVTINCINKLVEHELEWILHDCHTMW